MTNLLIQYIEMAAQHAELYGLLFVLVFMTVESSFVPFPSEVVMIPAGFLAARGAMLLGAPLPDAALCVLMGTAGSLLGAFINYGLFRWLGKPFLSRFGRYFLLPPPKVARAEQIFLQYGAGATFVCRLLPGIRQLISIPAGIAGMPKGKFAFYTGLGAGIWVTVLTIVGYGLGAGTRALSYAEIVHEGKRMIGQNLVFIVIGCVVLFGSYVLVQRRVMREQPVAAPARTSLRVEPPAPASE